MMVWAYIIAGGVLLGIVSTIVWLCWVTWKVFKDEENQYNN